MIRNATEKSSTTFTLSILKSFKLRTKHTLWSLPSSLHLEIERKMRRIFPFSNIVSYIIILTKNYQDICCLYLRLTLQRSFGRHHGHDWPVWSVCFQNDKIPQFVVNVFALSSVFTLKEYWKKQELFDFDSVVLEFILDFFVFSVCTF